MCVTIPAKQHQIFNGIKTAIHVGLFGHLPGFLAGLSSTKGTMRIVPSVSMRISILAPVCSIARMARAISAWVNLGGVRGMLFPLQSAGQ